MADAAADAAAKSAMGRGRGAATAAAATLKKAQQQAKEADDARSAAITRLGQFTVLLLTADKSGGAQVIGGGTVAADVISTVGPCGFCGHAWTSAMV